MGGMGGPARASGSHGTESILLNNDLQSAGKAGEADRRDALKAALDAEGIGTALFYRVALHHHPAFAEMGKRPLPVSERLAETVLSIPMNPDLTDDEVDRVIAAIRRFAELA